MFHGGAVGEIWASFSVGQPAARGPCPASYGCSVQLDEELLDV